MASFLAFLVLARTAAYEAALAMRWAAPAAPAVLLAVACMVGFRHDDPIARFCLGVAVVAAAIVSGQVTHLVNPPVPPK